MNREQRGRSGKTLRFESIGNAGEERLENRGAARLELPMTRQEQQGATGLDLAAISAAS